MDDTICFLNTDLELVSVENLTRLAAAFEAKGMWALEPATQGPDGLWYANFEMDPDNHEPEPNIAAMLDIVEVLEEPLRTTWLKCTLREFNLGYDCGSKPWAFNQGLSNGLLGRIAAAGASFRLTLYPPEREKIAEKNLPQTKVPPSSDA